MAMQKYIIVTDKAERLAENSDWAVVSPGEFIRHEFSSDLTRKQKPKVINLCNNFDYLGQGYYVSLLAEARGLRCIPGVSSVIALNWKRNYDFALPELNDLMKKHFHEPGQEPLKRTYTTYFGRHENPSIEPLARRLFDLFRFPVISFEIKYVNGKKWVIEKIEAEPYGNIPEDRLKVFNQALKNFTGSAWKSQAQGKKPEKYWIAILHDPQEKMPPSSKTALKNFIRVGKKMGLWVELITKQDYASLLEFDALFIRETTAINNHTYRFASKAEQEDIPSIDDTKSIIRCCNKVYLHELLSYRRVPVPHTDIIDKRNVASVAATVEFPCVIKIPDGSFSRGIEKVVDAEEFKTKAQEMLKKSDVILCQEFVESEYDWRIGVLNGEVLFGIQYYMAKGHWQIYNHKAVTKKLQSGDHRCVPVKKIPKEVISHALNAAKWIGNGLYGVDLKQTKDGRIVVIEVNDNPNIDHDVEAEILGDEIYQKILEHIVRMIEA